MASSQIETALHLEALETDVICRSPLYKYLFNLLRPWQSTIGYLHFENISGSPFFCLGVHFFFWFLAMGGHHSYFFIIFGVMLLVLLGIWKNMSGPKNEVSGELATDLDSLSEDERLQRLSSFIVRSAFILLVLRIWQGWLISYRKGFPLLFYVHAAFGCSVLTFFALCSLNGTLMLYLLVLGLMLYPSVQCRHFLTEASAVIKPLTVQLDRHLSQRCMTPDSQSTLTHEADDAENDYDSNAMAMSESSWNNGAVASNNDLC